MRFWFVEHNPFQGKKIKRHERRDKTYRALLVFYKATIVPMVHWSFEGAGFLHNEDNIRNPVQIGSNRVLARIAVPGHELNDSFIYPDQIRKEVESKNAPRKRALFPNPREFALSLAAYVQAAVGTRPLCGREQEEGVSNEE
jgi:hypothetical protein